MAKTDWKLRYAPHIGFRGIAQPLFLESVGSADPVDQIAYIAELGFAGVLDNTFLERSADDQRRIGKALEKHGLEMSCFALRSDPEAASVLWGSASAADALEPCLKRAIEAAKRANGRWIIASSARDFALPPAYEMAGMIKTVRRLVPMLEKAGVHLCIEHVNAPRLPDRLLQHLADAYLVACGAESDAVKIAYDVVHVQIMDGNLIENVDRCLDKIGVFQLADVPPRCEPGSGGEINFVGLLGHIRKRGFRGLLDLEHDCQLPGKAGEQKALERLRHIDAQI